MKIYDISQEVFGAQVYPGDPAPKKEVLGDMQKGDLYNLTAFSMCAHNGTHIDAPYHFIKEGKTVDALALEACIGWCSVITCDGVCDRDTAQGILTRAGGTYGKRILLKGKTTVSLEAAQVFAAAGVYLLGNESQTVGPQDAPMAVHKALLGAGVVLLEGVRLTEVPDGYYFLSAQPLNLGGADGAPCRAVLIEFGEENRDAATKQSSDV